VKIAPNFLQHSYFHLDSPLLVWGLVEAEPLTFTLPPPSQSSCRPPLPQRFKLRELSTQRLSRPPHSKYLYLALTWRERPRTAQRSCGPT
jgi:hypothetical protein